MMQTTQRIAVTLIAAGLSGCRLLPVRREDLSKLPAVGNAVEATWTATTWESASTPKHRKILESGRLKTIVGEVVDVSCFLQLGKRGEAHIPCGQKCARNGQPIGVLTDQGRLYLVVPEEHHARRDGQVNLKERFAELMGKRVQVSGMVTNYLEYRAIFVRSLPEEPAK